MIENPRTGEHTEFLSETEDLRPGGPGGTFALDPPGAPGTYVVALFAQGVGDAAYRFRWSV